MTKSVAIVLAAGNGKRMNNKIPKQYLAIDGKPVLYYCLVAFEKSSVEDIILVVSEGEQEYCKTEVVEKYNFKKIKQIVVGGYERYESVYAGLSVCDKDYDVVLIHDSAKPMITVDIIETAIDEAVRYGACVVAVPVKDTIKVSDVDGFAHKTLRRDELWSAQTPQAFKLEICKRAYDILMHSPGLEIGITDDAMVVEKMLGISVRLCMGDYKNIKITTPEDLIMATQYLEKKN